MKYYKLSQYVKDRFGCKVYKVSIDAGFSCPNQDGTKSFEGCIFCDNDSFSYNKANKITGIDNQISSGIEYSRARGSANKFIGYFQAFSNTYADIKELKRVYDKVAEYDDIVMLAIGTRPDCLDLDKIKLIDSYTKDREVWLELGLQSANDKTLEIINRHHTVKDFVDAVKLIRENSDIKVCAHVILGLPFEKEEDIINSAKLLFDLNIDGVKIHPLHVIKNTALEKMYERKEFELITFDTYIDLVCKFIRGLSEKTVIHRITADCPKEILVAPRWINYKGKILDRVEKHK